MFEELKKAREQVLTVLEQAKSLIPQLSHYENEFSQPVKFSVLASFSTGKSTFLNALLFGTEILHTGIGETTRGTFTISYGENICYEVEGGGQKCTTDLEGLKKLIKEDNKKAAEEERSFFAKIQVNLPKVKDLIVFDTPGFGGLKENELKDIIGQACQSADGILFLLDISRGLSQYDAEDIKKYITNIGKELPQLSIWVVFNKLDWEEERSEEKLCHLMSDTLVNLDLLDEKDRPEFSSFEKLATKNAFAISAKQALHAQMPNEDLPEIRQKELTQNSNKREEWIRQSRMRFFETHFFAELPKRKVGIFRKKIDECISQIEREIQHINDLITSSEKILDEEIAQKNDKITNLEQYIKTIESTQEEFLNQKKKYTSEIKKLKNSYLSNSFHELTRKISSKLIECVLSSLKIFGDSSEELIMRGVDNAKFGIQIFIKEYVENIVEIPINLLIRTGTVVDIFNNSSEGYKLELLSNGLEGRLKYLDKAVLVSQIVTDIIFVGITLDVLTIFGGKSTRERIIEKLGPELRKSLPSEVETILLQELYDKFAQDIINDIGIIVDQIDDYLHSLDMEKLLADDRVDEAEEEVSLLKAEERKKINEYNGKKENLTDYKNKLCLAKETKIEGYLKPEQLQDMPQEFSHKSYSKMKKPRSETMNFGELKKAREQVFTILEQAKSLIPSLSHYEDDFSQPVKFAVLASFSAGKSTFLNALLFGTEILHTGTSETTRGAFTISYGKNICYEVEDGRPKCTTDLNGLKKLIKKDNEKAGRENRSFSAKIQVDCPNVKDLIAFDTPGFGGLKENELKNIIGQACQSADGILFLLDISRGLARDDALAIEKYITAIGKELSQLPIWVVFNKLDSEEERSEEEHCSLMSETLAYLNLLDEKDRPECTSFEKLATKNAFAVSAKQALHAQMPDEDLPEIRQKELTQNSNKREEWIRQSRMRFFETHFFAELPKTKVDIFKKKVDECIDQIDGKIQHINNLITSNEEILKKKITQKYDYKITNIEEYIKLIEDTQKEFSGQKRKYASEMKKLKNSNRSDSFKELTDKISSKLIECILSSLKNYGLIFGDSSKKLVKKGVENAKSDIEKSVAEYVGGILKSPIELVVETGTVVEVFKSKGYKIELLSDALRGRLKYLDKAVIKIEEELKKQGVKICDISDFFAVINAILDIVLEVVLSALMGLIAALIVELLIEFILTRLSTLLIPVVGWAVGIGLGVWSLFGGKSTAEKIIEEVGPELHKSLPGEVKKILLQELHNKFIQDIINDLEIIMNQVNEYFCDLDIEKSVASDINEAEKRLSQQKAEAQKEIDKYNGRKEKLTDYKNKLCLAKEAKTEPFSNMEKSKETPDINDKGYSKMKVPELRALAKKRQIRRFSRMKKADLIDALEKQGIG